MWPGKSPELAIATFIFFMVNLELYYLIVIRGVMFPWPAVHSVPAY